MIKESSNNINEEMPVIWNGSVAWWRTSDVIQKMEMHQRSSFGCTDAWIYENHQKNFEHLCRARSCHEINNESP
jgi:hypothetical protein